MSQQCRWGVGHAGSQKCYVSVNLESESYLGTRPVCKGDNKPQIQTQIPGKIQTGTWLENEFRGSKGPLMCLGWLAKWVRLQVLTMAPTLGLSGVAVRHGWCSSMVGGISCSRHSKIPSQKLQDFWQLSSEVLERHFCHRLLVNTSLRPAQVQGKGIRAHLSMGETVKNLCPSPVHHSIILHGLDQERNCREQQCRQRHRDGVHAYIHGDGVDGGHNLRRRFVDVDRIHKVSGRLWGCTKNSLARKLGFLSPACHWPHLGAFENTPA